MQWKIQEQSFSRTSICHHSRHFDLVKPDRVFWVVPRVLPKEDHRLWATLSCMMVSLTYFWMGSFLEDMVTTSMMRLHCHTLYTAGCWWSFWFHSVPYPCSWNSCWRSMMESWWFWQRKNRRSSCFHQVEHKLEQTSAISMQLTAYQLESLRWKKKRKWE